MSHFTCLVLLPPTAKHTIDEALNAALAPYSEELEVPEYDKKCYCVGNKASNAVREVINPKIDDLRKQFATAHPLPAYAKHPFDLTEEDSEKQDEAWEAFIKPVLDEQDTMLKVHPDYEKPDADCDDCKGTGTHKSTSNPEGYWDWWVIGGRWTGSLDGYEPAKDPDNVETCFLCNGTGKRTDMVVAKGCNGCQGEGKTVKWPTQWKAHNGDIQPVSEILKRWDDKSSFYSLITGDGKWHAQATMGWFGMSHGKKASFADWRTELKKKIADYPDYIGVLCDLHV